MRHRANASAQRSTSCALLQRTGCRDGCGVPCAMPAQPSNGDMRPALLATAAELLWAASRSARDFVPQFAAVMSMFAAEAAQRPALSCRDGSPAIARAPGGWR